MASGAASAAACGVGITEPSPAASEISTAGMTSHLSTARRAFIFSAAIPPRPVIVAQVTSYATTLSNDVLRIVSNQRAEPHADERIRASVLRELTSIDGAN